MATNAHRLLLSSRLPNTRPAERLATTRVLESFNLVYRLLEVEPINEDTLRSDETKAYRVWLMRKWKR